MRRTLASLFGSSLGSASHPAAVGSCKGATAAWLQLATDALTAAPAAPAFAPSTAGAGTSGSTIGAIQSNSSSHSGLSSSCGCSGSSRSGNSGSGNNGWDHGAGAFGQPPLGEDAPHLHATASFSFHEDSRSSSSSGSAHTSNAPHSPASLSPLTLSGPVLGVGAAAGVAAAAAASSLWLGTASLPVSALSASSTAASTSSLASLSSLSTASSLTSLSSLSAASLAACSPGEPSLAMSAVQQLAGAYEAVHGGCGLPWAAAIPAVTLALRLALLPLSMRQARIIRSNYSLYKEALALTDAQEAEAEAARQLAAGEQGRQQRHEAWQQGQQGQGGAAGAGGAASLVASTSQGAGAEAVAKREADLRARLLRSQAVLANFHLLRAKVGAPHPGWLVLNPLVQVPVFVAVSTTLGIMARLPWPGLESEGMLWFPDLTLPAMVFPATGLIGASGFADASSPAFAAATAAAAAASDAATAAGAAAAAAATATAGGGFPGVGATADLVAAATAANEVLLPMGATGLALPLVVYAMTMTSLRLGFGAAGVAAAQSPDIRGTALGAFLRSLPPLLYLLTTANLYLKFQMAHGVLLHWAASAGFTLGLQTALRNPTLRTWLKLNPGQQGGAAAPAAAATATASGGGAAAATATDGGSSSVGGKGSRFADLPSELVARVAETSDPNVLVIMGAQLSARQHYPGALHCFRKAVLLNPSHVRAHYSMGQVHSLTGSWPDAEQCYRAAAALSPPDGPERGQALYCVATALHSQGKLLEAADAYAAADALWRGQAVVAFGRANALAAAGRAAEALAAVEEAQARDAGTPGRPFAAVLTRLREQLAGAVGGSGSGSGSGGGEGQGDDGSGGPKSG
ncbi:hypothetical protein CHLRE_08g373583v5 [Chlamydomonas reinhardtii]|uniref:Uncharacterized protein n=1 Tax=Chlamydomonas reinhardtii TaxID=3055 RepID=A0A2K3DHK4_CHLRE|nr:uncharacterized protein CHLRE_08g373583v5 [Chlamydomonas reinhardtii]PNW79997.1 hypothetical protein CHLRE_08g373583v5 [Chlamydomonas reinhardtii]